MRIISLLFAVLAFACGSQQHDSETQGLGTSPSHSFLTLKAQPISAKDFSIVAAGLAGCDSCGSVKGSRVLVTLPANDALKGTVYIRINQEDVLQVSPSSRQFEVQIPSGTKLDPKAISVFTAK